MGPPYGKNPILFPYHSHIFRDSYHKGVPLLGVSENPTEYMPFISRL